MSQITNHDEYIARAATLLQPSLIELRNQIRDCLPDADEIISYNMPGYGIDGATIVGYAAFSKQCGLYVNPEAIASLSDEITAAGFRHTKNGVTFIPGKPLPKTLVKKLVLSSRKSSGR